MANRRLAGAVVALMSFPAALGGCATIEGAPRRVIGVTESVALANRYRLDEAVQNFFSNDAGDRMDMSREQYRNMIVAVYLNAIDARYYSFRNRVSGERRELDAGFDIAVLTLTNAITAAATGHARDLAAITSMFGGTGAALNQNLFFDRALPGLLANMDTQRLLVRTEIVTNLRESAHDYPLTTAIGDLNRYEMAASLDRAIEEATTQAGNQREEARRRYENAVRACDTQEDLTTNRRRVMRWVLDRQAEADNAGLPALRALANELEVDAQGDASAIRTAIEGKLITDFCSNARLEELIGKLEGFRQGGAG